MANALYVATFISESPTGSKKSNSVFLYAPDDFDGIVGDIDGVVGGTLITKSTPVYEYAGADWPAGSDLGVRVTLIDPVGNMFNTEIYDVDDLGALMTELLGLKGDANIKCPNGSAISGVSVKVMDTTPRAFSIG
jgi:hypothetical protein